MGDLLALSRRCNRIVATLPGAVNRIKQEVVRKVARDLITVTPVDVTEALSNWQVGINSPPAFPLPAIFPGVAGNTESASEGAAIEHADKVIVDILPGERVFISNLVPHIVFLNDGTSAQEPGGFVERAVVLGRIVVRNARLNLDGGNGRRKN